MVATPTPRSKRNGRTPDLQLSHNAEVVLERRYLAKDDQANVIETPEGLFRRVATNLAQAERNYGGDDGRVGEVEEQFYRLLTRLDFLPNSPTLGNAGRPLQQLSACFVLPVEDSLEAIFETVKHAALIHQTGGGTGFAFSRLRPEGSIVRSTAGVASGPVSFMKVFDGATEAIKQGGVRRGANMGILRVDHPDIDKFVAMKGDMTTLQNFNISVAVTEAFMRAVEAGADYDLIDPHTGKVAGTKNARDLWEVLVAHAWQNGDPGLIFIDRMNETRSNPVPTLGPIESTNPCAAAGTRVLTPTGWRMVETIQVGDAITTVSGPGQVGEIEVHENMPVWRVSFANGASVRVTAAHQFHARARVPVLAGAMSEPPAWRPVRLDMLGVGDEIRTLDGSTSIVAIESDGADTVYDLYEPESDTWITEGVVSRGCGEQPLYAYDSCNLGSINLAKFVLRSAASAEVDWGRLAEVVALCVRLLDNVIDMNKYPLPQIQEVSNRIRRIGLGVMGWADLLYEMEIPYDSDEALELAERVMRFIQEEADKASAALAEERGAFPAWPESIYGPEGDPVASGGLVNTPLRHSTRTTIAPTGTLSIIADCSGGIEPVFSLAFMRQHYLDPKHPTKPTQLTEVNQHFEQVARREGFHSEELINFLAEGGHLADRPEVPDWVKRVFVTAHDIAPEWHVKTQSAFQKYTDNAVSKTINFANSATVDDVERAYLLAYHNGAKGITIYRDGSREYQVLSHKKSDKAEEPVAAPVAEWKPRRQRLPDERQSLTHKFVVGEQEGYITVGLFEDGRPGEVFLRVSKQGSTVSGLMESLGQLTSIALQYGVPLEGLAAKMKNSRFEPSGMTGNREIPTATSLVDYLFRWLERRYGYGDSNGHAATTPKPEVHGYTNGNGAANGNGLHHGPNGSGNANGMGYVSLYTPADAARDESGVGCPECGSLLHYAEGCMTCRSCGYTKCG